MRRNGRTGFLRFSSIVAALGVSTASIAVSLPAQAQDIGRTIGGILGNAIRGGNGGIDLRNLREIAGTLVGQEIAKALSRPDRQRLERATDETIRTGETRDFEGERRGVSGRTEVVSSERRSGQAEVPVLRDRISDLPPLEFIDQKYEVTARSDIYGGPAGDYRTVGSLRRGDVVTVTGKVQNAAWYLVSQDGVGIGFVPEDRLEATEAPATRLASASEPVETRQTEVERVCRQVRQTVMVNGREQSEDITACQTANGWEVV